MWSNSAFSLFSWMNFKFYNELVSHVVLPKRLNKVMLHLRSSWDSNKVKLQLRKFVSCLLFYDISPSAFIWYLLCSLVCLIQRMYYCWLFGSKHHYYTSANDVPPLHHNTARVYFALLNHVISCIASASAKRQSVLTKSVNPKILLNVSPLSRFSIKSPQECQLHRPQLLSAETLRSKSSATTQKVQLRKQKPSSLTKSDRYRQLGKVYANIRREHTSCCTVIRF